MQGREGTVGEEQLPLKSQAVEPAVGGGGFEVRSYGAARGRGSWHSQWERWLAVCVLMSFSSSFLSFGSFFFFFLIRQNILNS